MKRIGCLKCEEDIEHLNCIAENEDNELGDLDVRKQGRTIKFPGRNSAKIWLKGKTERGKELLSANSSKKFIEVIAFRQISKSPTNTRHQIMIS